MTGYGYVMGRFWPRWWCRACDVKWNARRRVPCWSCSTASPVLVVKVW